MAPRSFLFVFHVARVDWVLIILVTQKNGPLGPCFKTIFPFLMTMVKTMSFSRKYTAKMFSLKRFLVS